MLKGRTVKVYPLQEGAKDSHGNKLREYTEYIEVANVLIAPLSNQVSDVNNDPMSDIKRVSFYLPKGTDCAIWQNAKVDTGADVWLIEGVPHPYPEELTPGKWNAVATGVEYVR